MLNHIPEEARRAVAVLAQANAAQYHKTLGKVFESGRPVRRQGVIQCQEAAARWARKARRMLGVEA